MDEKKVKINDCGCSIDEILSGKSCGESPENKKDDRLCSAHESDFEVFVDPDVEKVSHDFYLRKLTDGLPVIPPTRERVNRFLKYTDMEPDEVVAVLPPLHGKATIEKIAINSVMAGCIPQFMGVVQHAEQRP